MDPSLASLWLPIVMSAVGVFILSSLIWTVIQWHNSDWKKLPNEDGVRTLLRNVPSGQYAIPYAAGMKDRKNPEWQRMAKKGPTAMLTVCAGDATQMGKPLIQWLVYCLVISVIIAAVAVATLSPGDGFMMVFHSVAIYGAMTYSGAHAMGAIWFGNSWGRAVKEIVDGILYALVTAVIFAWLWPA